MKVSNFDDSRTAFLHINSSAKAMGLKLQTEVSPSACSYCFVPTDLWSQLSQRDLGSFSLGSQAKVECIYTITLLGFGHNYNITSITFSQCSIIIINHILTGDNFFPAEAPQLCVVVLHWRHFFSYPRCFYSSIRA